MKSFLISDNHDTWVGMRLAGISGVIVHEKDEILKEIDKVLEDKEIGILIVTELIMETAKKNIGLKRNKIILLLLKFPIAMDSETRKTEHDYIKESIGIGV